VDLVMEDLLDTVLELSGYDPVLCLKYVDDLLLIIPKEEVENTLNLFNGYSKYLKFTMEPEVNGRLPYLDVELIKQNDGRILTKWYSKEMASNRMLNYKSNHPLQQKLNVASNLIKRVCELTTINSPKDNQPVIRNILVKNNYPVSLINKLFSNYLNIKESERKDKVTNTSEIKYRTFPNVNNLTDKIIKCVKKYDPNIKICPKNFKTIKNLHSKVKDKISIKHQTNCIYCVLCKDCEEEYWGMTQQRVGRRLDQHLGDIELLHKWRVEFGIEKEFGFKEDIDRIMASEIMKEQEKGNPNSQEISNKPQTTKKRTRKKKNEETRLDKIKKLSKQYEKSGIVSHHVNLGHRIDFNNAKVVERESNRTKLEILEMLYIKTNSNNMNKKEDLLKLRNNYDGVLNKIKNKNERRLLRNKNSIVKKSHQQYHQ
jgi:hypothetical protein